MCAISSFSLSARSRVTTEPINTSPPPDGYLVSACMHRSTPRPSPRSNGRNAMPAPQVLSNATQVPRCRAVRTSARKSGNSIVIEPGASIHTSRVRSLNAAS